MFPVYGVVLPARRSSLDGTIVQRLPLVERAVLGLHRGGLGHIVVSGERLDDATLAARLTQGSVDITIRQGGVLDAVPRGCAAILVTADVVFEPGVIGTLLEATAVDPTRGRFSTDALGGLLACLPAAVLDALRTRDSIHQGMFEFYRSGTVVGVDLGPLFCRPVPPSGAVRTLERDYRRRVRGATSVLGGIRRIWLP